MNAMVNNIIIPLPTGTSVPCRNNTKESKRRIYDNRPGKMCHYKFLHLNEIFLLSHHIFILQLMASYGASLSFLIGSFISWRMLAIIGRFVSFHTYKTNGTS